MAGRSANRSASPPRASRERSRLARNAPGTSSSDSTASQMNHSSWYCCTAANRSRHEMPATLGSIARRRGGEAAFQRAPITTAPATHVVETIHRLSSSTTRATSASGKASRKLPGCSRKRCQKSSTASWSTNPPTSSRSTRDRSRPPVLMRQQQGEEGDPPDVLQHLARVLHGERVEADGQRLDQEAQPGQVHQQPAAAVRPAAPGDQPAGQERAAERPVDVAIAGRDLGAREDGHQDGELQGDGRGPHDRPEGGPAGLDREAAERGRVALAPRSRGPVRPDLPRRPAEDHPSSWPSSLAAGPAALRGPSLNRVR